MSTVINELRKIEGNSERIKLKKLVVSKSSGRVDFEFISDKAAGDDVIDNVKSVLAKYLPVGFSVGNVSVVKIVADGELVSRSAFDFIESKYKSVAHSLSPGDISSITNEEGCTYIVSASEDVCRYFTDNGVLEQITEYLGGEYCSEFFGKLKNIGKPQINTEILKVKTNSTEYETLSVRSLKVADPVKLWGDDIDPYAVYMADSALVSGDVTFAGTVSSIMQKETKNGKTMYVVEFGDTTGKISGKIFKTIEKEKKMEKIQVGTQILTRGDLSLFNGVNSYVIRDLSFCVFPSDFIPEERAGKAVPSEYSLVFPERLTSVSQSDLFTVEKPTEECLKGKSFVVVDIETTGLSFVGGDKITEIGAVRIVDGKIVDKFQTLINPEQSISKEITSLTGIDDSMVANSPTFDKVIPDFYKYCYGSTIVAHNIEFDYKFIKFMAQNSGYTFKNPGIDTLAFSKSALPRMKNYKLNTVCGYFGIQFLHHRALSDAHATAQLFIKLAEVKKSLPEAL